MENLPKILWLIPTLPLLGFVVNGLWGKKQHPVSTATIGCAGPIMAFALSVAAFYACRDKDLLFHADWIVAGELSVSFGLRVDHLTATMLLVVTGVGSLIHIYSYGYMHADKGFARYFAYLNLFMFSMLVLVLADNLFVMFVGWEGVGLCSYLLIGFWFEDHKNADAGRKAFITNRIGDFGFLLGMFALFALGHSLDFRVLQGHITDLKLEMVLDKGPFAGWKAGSVLEFAAACLFLGATGKSAQIPLFVWLPDAMAGPTPVSALIHAATMVTAGVYMIGRMHFLYVLTPQTMEIIALVAALTAFLTAVIAVAQNDIKKILAYSTISQLGFMFAGMATAHFATGIFHLVTHAFFKALLFLGAGAVIHALDGEQDIRNMGGLAKPMRALFVIFGIGAFALMGCPGFAGYYSKDMILTAVAAKDWDGIWTVLLVTAACTAFYTTRMLVLVFLGRGKNEHPHAPGLSMMGPLALLAVLSATGGMILEHPIEKWLGGAPADAEAHHRSQIASWVAFGAGFLLAGFLYVFRRGWVKSFVESELGRPLHRFVENKCLVDELYEYVVIAPVKMGASVLWYLFDKILIDTILVGGSGKVVYAFGGLLRRTQTGSVNAAAAAMAVGALAILGWLLWRLIG